MNAARALIIAFLLAASACKRESARPGVAPNSAPVRVQIQMIEAKKTISREEVVGTVRAKLQATIEAKVSARVERMLADPGQSVHAGDLLVQLDPREIQARLDQAMTERDQLARDVERLRGLKDSGAVSKQQFETVQSRQQMSAAAATEAETLLGYTRVLAPFDGIITRKLVDVGDLAGPGKPLLHMENPALLRLELDVPESLIGQVEQSAELPVQISGYSGVLTGKVSEIAPAADPFSRTFLVKLDLPQKPGLRGGVFGRASLPLCESVAVQVPAAAVLQRGQMEFIFIYSAGRAQLRIVKTGHHSEQDVELVSGVTAGEQIIVRGIESLRDGMRVEIAP